MKFPGRILLPQNAAMARRGSPLVVSVQRGQIAISGATTQTATISAVNMDNCVLRLLGFYAPSSINNAVMLPHVTLTNSTTVTATRTGTTATATTVVFEVIEYAVGVIRSIQRGFGVVTAQTTNITIAAVTDMTKTTMVFNGFTSSFNGAMQGIHRMYLSMASPTTITMFQLSLLLGAQSAYQVTEWN